MVDNIVLAGLMTVTAAVAWAITDILWDLWKAYNEVRRGIRLSS